MEIFWFTLAGTILGFFTGYQCSGVIERLRKYKGVEDVEEK